MAIIEVSVGPRQVDDGAVPVARAGRSSELIVSQAHARYYEQASRGTIFTASNQAAQAVSVALATTYTGLCLSNPNTSTKNLVLLGCNYALTVAPVAIASLHLLAGYSTSDVTHTTPVTVLSSIVGQTGANIARVDREATISTPYYLKAMGSGFTAGALYATTPNWIDIGGSIIIPPGGFVAWGALTAVTGFGSFVWEEAPV